MYFNYLDEELKQNAAMGQEVDLPKKPEEPESFETKDQDNGQACLEALQERVQRLMQESEDDVFTQYLSQMQQRVTAQRKQVELLQEELEQRYRMYQTNLQMRQRTMPSQPQPVFQPQPQDSYQPVLQTQTQPVLPRQKKSAESAIGAALGIVGGVFILVALVFAGVYYMNGFIKGMGLYVICLLVMLLAELLLYPKWKGFGMTLSAIGMSGLYISTLINYLALGNFDMWVALGVTFLITLGVLFLSRKRDAISYRILGMAAVYVCALVGPIGEQIRYHDLTQTEFFAAIVILFVINIMCLAVPVRKAYTAVNITHMSLNTVFTFLVLVLGTDEWSWSSISEIWTYPLLVALSLVILQMIFVIQVCRQVKTNPECSLTDNVGICIAYGICGLVYLFMATMVTNFSDYLTAVAPADGYLSYRLTASAIAVLLCMTAFVVLRKRPEKWFSWYLLNFLVFCIHANASDDWELVWCIVILMIFAKALSFTKNTILQAGDALLTACCCLYVLLDHEEIYVMPLFVVLLLSVLCINYWKEYFELVLTYTIAAYISWHMLTLLKLPVFVGILFVGMLLFNNVKRWRGKAILLYNVFALAGQAVCFLLLANPVYQNAYITYLCMLIFGLSTIVICFQKKYHMEFRIKLLILALFLTYMALIIRTNYPVINSILLMLIALISVGMGFAERKKSVRVYGLVLSFVVCGKIVLYDFLEAPVLQKTILFFAVGVIALVISAIYMILEKHIGKKQLVGAENTSL